MELYSYCFSLTVDINLENTYEVLRNYDNYVKLNYIFNKIEKLKGNTSYNPNSELLAYSSKNFNNEIVDLFG